MVRIKGGTRGVECKMRNRSPVPAQRSALLGLQEALYRHELVVGPR